MFSSHFRIWIVGFALLMMSSASSLHASVIQLITNGNFESGTFAGWTVSDLAGGSGTWFIDAPGTTTPSSAYITAGNGLGGNFYAVTDQGGPGTHALLQTFVVPVGMTSMSLSYQMFVNDQSGQGPIVNPAGLNHTVSPNQHARVDILTASATPFSTALSDVVSNLYLGIDVGTNPRPYTAYSFDISSLSPGATYQLRFAEVDNQLFFHQGVDNVSILATTGGGVIPEPASGMIWLSLLGMSATFRRNRRSS